MPQGQWSYNRKTKRDADDGEVIHSKDDYKRSIVKS